MTWLKTRTRRERERDVSYIRIHVRTSEVGQTRLENHV